MSQPSEKQIRLANKIFVSVQPDWRPPHLRPGFDHKSPLDRLRTLLKDEQFAKDEQAKAYLAEAEKLIEGKE